MDWLYSRTLTPLYACSTAWRDELRWSDPLLGPEGEDKTRLNKEGRRTDLFKDAVDPAG